VRTLSHVEIFFFAELDKRKSIKSVKRYDPSEIRRASVEKHHPYVKTCSKLILAKYFISAKTIVTIIGQCTKLERSSNGVA